jgi:hypothetical protein
MNFSRQRRQKKNFAHMRNFNKQNFTNWEFINQDHINPTHNSTADKPKISSQFLIFFILMVVLYSFTKTVSTWTLDFFFYDLWDDVATLFSSQYQSNSGNTSLNLKNLPNNFFNHTLAKTEIFHFTGTL